ncbi:MAG: autotransporter-associated beta strand repeat-containing protein [Akkermansia sp.]|nr:autotransporter-associated beta strand repeat-containing protein [Akkermansia sp.]
MAGATMNNSAIDATYMTISGTSSFVGDVTVSTLLTLGADLAITLGADASLTLGEGALIDLANATYTEDAFGNRTYSVFAAGSTGTHNLADLTASMIKDAQMGYEYGFADGAIIMSLVSKEVFFGDGSMTWNDEADNTPFVNASDEAVAFATGDVVTFNGTGTADVTLGEAITATGVTVAETATVNMTAGTNTLTVAAMDVDGTLNYTGTALTATTLTVNGTLNYNVAEGEATMGNTIAGTGTLQKTGEGTLNLGSLKSSNITAALHVSEGVLKFTDPYNGSNGEEGVSTPHFLNIISKLTTSGTGKLLIDGDVAYNRQSGSSAIEIDDNVEVAGLLYVNSWTANCTYNVVSGGQLTVGNRLYLSNAQIMNVSGGSLDAGSISLGHGAGAGYTSKLIIENGTVKTGGILLRHDNASTISMTGGELEFTPADASTSVIYADNGTSGYDGNAVAAASNLNLSFTGGKLVAKDSSWLLGVSDTAANVKISGVTIETAADKTATLAGNINFTPAEGAEGTITKTGAGTLKLNVTEGVTITKLAIQGGYVGSAKAITLSALEITDGGLAYDLSNYGLITAANYSGALTLNLSNATEGDYEIFQGAESLSADQITVDSGADSRIQVTHSVVAGLVSIHVSMDTAAKTLTWDTNGADNVWSTGGATNWDSDSTPGADTSFYDGDDVAFAGAGEEITISGDVAPASVTVSGEDYSFAGSGKIVGEGTLTVENGGSLEIKSKQRYTGGTTVAAGGELILSTGGETGALKGDIDVYGTLKLNANDATGWGGGADVVSSINAYEGGLVSATTTDNLTGSGTDINLQGGAVSGVAGSNWDLAYGGAERQWSQITAEAAAGATATHPTVSTISDVRLSLRQNATIISVEENAQLVISSVIAQKGDRINGEAGTPEGSVAGLNKVGAGELVLSGVNTYNQATTVAAGTLTLADGGVLNSVVTVNDGATFKLEGGSTYGAAGLAGEGSIIKTGSGIAKLTAATTVSSLDIQEGFVQTGAETATISTLTATAGTGFAYDLAAGQKKVVAESFDGPITLKLISLANGTFELMQGAAGLDASDVNFEYSVGSRVQVDTSVVDGLAKLEVTIGTNNLDNLVWNTGGASDDWAAGGAANWTSGGAAEQFLNGDSVTFAGTGETITISGTVSPAAMTVTGTGYVFEGTGAIGGTCALTVAGGAEATISTVNTFTGGTTIAEGATLTITKAKALSTFNNMTNETVLGKVSGAGTLVINLDSETREAVAKGSGENANMGGFTGIVDVQRGTFFVGERNNGDGAGAVTVFAAQKVILREEGRMWLHTDGNVWELGAAVDAMSGAELNNRTGKNKLNGKVRFNVSDLENGSYDADGCVTVRQHWGGEMNFAGLLEGDGTVQLLAPLHSVGTYKITGDNNSFAGTYKVVDSQDANAKVVNLRLGSQNAAQYADIKLATTASASYLLLDSDATINGLYGVVDAENAVQAQGGNRTLTVTEGDFGGLIMNSGENVLSLTKQGAGTLVLRGANTYTGATTINGGTLEVAEGATMGTTAITVNNGGTLKVNAGTYANSITGVGTIAKGGTGSASLSGIDAAFAGTIDVQGGTLNVGDALEIGTGRTLKAGETGATLSSALTLSGGTLALDYAGTGNALSLNNGVLTLAGGTTLSLSGLSLNAEAENTITLLTGVGSLQGGLDDGALASEYFSTITGLGSGVDSSTVGLQLVNGNLQLYVPVQATGLEWGEGTGTWVTGGDFTADDEDFTADAAVRFGALTGESDTVTISGALSVGQMTVDAGEGKTYEFTAENDASGIASVEGISINSGTASFGTGTLDMADGSITVNKGATLSLANGAITTANAVDLELKNGSALEWQTGNTTDYSSAMDVANGAAISLVNNSGSAISLTAGSLNENGETATVSMSGGNFKLVAGSLNGTVDMGTGVNVELLRSAASFAQNFTGEGGLIVNPHQGVRRISGENTYSGETRLDARLIVEGAQALSANTVFTGNAGQLYLSKAAGAGSAEYTINRVLVTSTNQMTYVGIGSNAEDADCGGPVTGVTLALGAQANVGGKIYVRGGNTLDVAAGATIGDFVDVAANATVKLHGAIANKIQGAGTVQVSGDITWDNTNKVYTGETQVLADSTLTASAPLTTGGGKVNVLENGAIIITDTTDWANKVYGAGALVLVNTVTNLDAVIDGSAADTLATAYVGMPTQTFSTTDVDGMLQIDDAAAANSAAKITNLVVNAGSGINVSTVGNALKIGQNLTLSGAGDTAAEPGTADAAALAITTASGETKINSNITLAADATIFAGGTGDHRLNGSFNGAGYTLTKTGSGFLGLGAFASGSTNDLSGDMDIQGGTIQLVGMGTAEARQAIGKTTMSAGTKLYFYSGHYDFADADGAIAFDGDATLDLGAEATAKLSTNVSGSSIVTMRSSGGNANGTLTLAADNDFSGTWQLNSAAWKLVLANADAVKNATVQMDAAGTLLLTDEAENYNITSLKGSATGAKVNTSSNDRHGLVITNTLTDVAASSYSGAVAGTVDVKLAGGVQKFTGTLSDGATFAVSDGTLAISSADQSGTHSFTTTGGVLDMTGYGRADGAAGADSIVALGGQVNGLNLAANMVLTGTSDVTAAYETITLGGNTVLGGGQMNFRVTDSTDATNTIPGLAGGLYKETNTLYQVGTGADDSISLTGGEKTSLNISLLEGSIIDPTPGSGAGEYRDHLLISGISGVTLGDASAYFDMNLENIGSTQYSLQFVQSAVDSTLADLVLRAMGAAETLFWDAAEGGVWNTAEGNTDWVKADMASGSPVATTTPADFEQYDHVIFDDLAGAKEITVTMGTDEEGRAIEIGSMKVQADSTNYTIKGSISSAAGNIGAMLSKTGAGTLTLTGANSYAGNTIITGGTVIAQNEAALSNTQVQIYGAGTWLVLDYASTGDGIFDATVKLDGSGTNPGGSLRALQDAKVNVVIAGDNAAKDVQVASGKTLELNVLSAVSTKLGGRFYINRDGMAGTLVMNLADNTTFTRTQNTEVYAGEYVLKGGNGTTMQDKSLLVAAGATTRVQGGMTLQVDTLGGISGTYGDVVLEDASKLAINSADAVTINNAITSEGATLTAQNATLKDLTLSGDADTTLAGGTWELKKGAISWADGADVSLALGENTTVKVDDDTLKSVKVDAAGATLTTAKTAADSVSDLSVGTITVGNGGSVSKVDLTITGTGSAIQGTVAGLTVAQEGKVGDATPALSLAGGVADSLTIERGVASVTATDTLAQISSGTVLISGADAALQLNGANALVKDDGNTAADITINAGKLLGAGGYTGQVTVDDEGEARTITLDGLSDKATVVLQKFETEKGVSTLKGMQNLTLAGSSYITLTSNLEAGEGNLLFDFADATGKVQLAEGATMTVDVNSVLGNVLDATEAGGITYTLADADISALGTPGKVVFDSVLNLYNIVASFNTDGTLVLSNTQVPLADESIYRSSDDNVDSTDWAGNGADVYSSGDKYASVYIDKDTVVDLKGVAPDAAHAKDGLVLSNLIGRGNGATLTIEGDGDDVVTINNNLEADDLGSNVKSLSFNGDIDVSGTKLQLLNTIATPGSADAGELDTESVYQVNGSLTADADSPVELTAGILRLNGRGNDTSTLEGGLTVESEMAQLQVSGAAEVGGKLQVSDALGGSDEPDDVMLLSGGMLTLMNGASVEAGFGIMAESQGKETLRVAENATAALGSGSSVQNAVLELQQGSALQVAADSLVSVRGLVGKGALVHAAEEGATSAPDIIITPTRNSVFSGDLSQYEGRISVIGSDQTTATQVFDKVTTAAAADSKLDMWLNDSAVINVAEETGNKTLNLRELHLLKDSETTFEVNSDTMAAGGAPALAVNTTAAMMPGAELLLSSTGTEVLSEQAELQLLTAAEGVNLSDWDGADITLDITDNAFRKMSESATLSVVGNGVYVNMTASSTNRYADAVSAPNALAGAALLWPVAPDTLSVDSALKAVDQAVADMLKAGDTKEAERVLAATAGASTAVLGSAFSADVERQLRAIRNRTTSMGVNQCEVNEGMPYVNAWINAEGDHREMDADGLAAGYSLDSWGGTVGVDVDITNNLTLGMAVTAMYGDLEADAADKADGDFDTQYVSLFARVAHKAWVHTFVATVGRADVTLDRTVSYADGSYKTKGETEGMGYGLMYEVARTYSLSEDGSTCWQPVVNLTWRHSSIDGYAESGSDAALAVGDQDMNVFTIGAGARLQTVIGENLYNRASIFEARALVKVDAGDREGEATVALLEGANDANVTAAEVGAVGVEIGAGVTIPVGLEGGSLFIDGSAEFRSGYSNVNGTVGYRINF